MNLLFKKVYVICKKRVQKGLSKEENNKEGSLLFLQ